MAHVWYRGKLLSGAQNLFNPSFYKNSDKTGIGQDVWVTKVDITPQQQKMIIASRPEPDFLRMLTPQLALHVVEAIELAPEDEQTALNTASIKLKL